MRAAVLALLVGMTGCATQDVAQTSHAARFDGPPETFRAAFAANCAAPSETLLRLSRETQECRILLPPDLTAWLIVSYDGTFEDLPYLALRQTLTPLAGSAMRLELSHYVIVPRRTGPAAKLLFPDRRVTARIHEAIRKIGGEPLELPAQPAGDL